MRFLGRVVGGLTVVTMAAASSVQAQCPVTSFCYFGTDVGGSSVTRAPNVNSLAARNDFFSTLTGVGTEDFEGIATGTSNPSLVFPGAGTASLAGPGAVESFAGAGANGAGRYPTSGTKFYEARLSGAAASRLIVDFSAPVAAFGFYGADIGDFGSTLNLRFHLVGGGIADWLLPFVPTDGTNTLRDGSLLYAGFINTTSFTRVEFIGSTTDDAFAFDDMTIANVRQVTPPTTVPEPATVALMATGLVGLGVVARRRRRA